MRHIKPETLARIKELAAEPGLKQSTYTGSHMFAVEHEDRDLFEDVSGYRTLITGDSESLAVSVIDENGDTKLFHNIDLGLDGVPMIVQPTFGVESFGEKVVAAISGARIGRPVVRALTEYEGLGLIDDLEATLFPRDINNPK